MEKSRKSHSLAIAYLHFYSFFWLYPPFFLLPSSSRLFIPWPQSLSLWIVEHRKIKTVIIQLLFNLFYIGLLWPADIILGCFFLKPGLNKGWDRGILWSPLNFPSLCFHPKWHLFLILFILSGTPCLALFNHFQNCSFPSKSPCTFKASFNLFFFVFFDYFL